MDLGIIGPFLEMDLNRNLQNDFGYDNLYIFCLHFTYGQFFENFHVYWDFIYDRLMVNFNSVFIDLEVDDVFVLFN